MGRKPVQITLAPSFNPQTVESGEATPQQLYDAWESWNLHKIRHEGATPEAKAHAYNEANLQMGRVERELRRRGLPKSRQDWEHRQENTCES